MDDKVEVKEGKPTYFGITHGTAQLKNWMKTRCVRNEHLFDEVVSEDRHYLSCDACGLVVFISGIDASWVPKQVREAIEKNEKEK